MFQPSLFSMDNFQSHHMSRTNINPYCNHMNFAENSNSVNANVHNVQHTKQQQIPRYQSHDSRLLLNNNAFGSEIKPILNLSQITNNDPSHFQCPYSSIYQNNNNNYNNNYASNPSSIRPQIEDTHSNSTMSSCTFNDSKNFSKYNDCTAADMRCGAWNNCVDNNNLNNLNHMNMNNNNNNNNNAHHPYSSACYSAQTHSNHRSNASNTSIAENMNMNNVQRANNHCVIHGTDMNPAHKKMKSHNSDLNFSIPIRILNAVNNNNDASPSNSSVSDSNRSAPNASVDHKINNKKSELAPHTNIECAICGAICATRQILVQHSQHYHKKICGYCGKKFARNSNLKEHIRIHTGFTPYVCSVCHRGFKQQHSLKDHIRTHTGEKPFQCELCGKRFTVKNNLKVHMRVHTGEKPYQCSVCFKRFTQKGSLNTHLRKVHKVSIEFKKRKQ